MKPKSPPLINFKDHLERFIKLSESEFEEIMHYFTGKKLKKHQLLIKAGNKVQHTYWTIRGLLISSFVDVNGKEHIIQFANEGCWITDQNAFYNFMAATFNISCVEESELLCLSYENREKLCSKFHKMARIFRKKANDSFTKQQKRLLAHLTADAQKRYDLLISEYPGLTHRLSKTILAEKRESSHICFSLTRRPSAEGIKCGEGLMQ